MNSSGEDLSAVRVQDQQQKGTKLQPIGKISLKGLQT